MRWAILDAPTLAPGSLLVALHGGALGVLGVMLGQDIPNRGTCCRISFTSDLRVEATAARIYDSMNQPP